MLIPHIFRLHHKVTSVQHTNQLNMDVRVQHVMVILEALVAVQVHLGNYTDLQLH